MAILLISASHVARVIGMSHWCQAEFFWGGMGKELVGFELRVYF
jgi:hypothetical protein